MAKDDWGVLAGWKALFEGGHILVTAQSAAMAEETINLVKDGFRKETDPYGKKWKPKKKSDGRKTLHGETGRLKSGWHVKHSKKAIVIAPSVIYAAAHQAPRRSWMPRRMMVPRGGKMPPAWSKQLKEAALVVARAYYSTKGGKSAKVAAKAAAKKRK